MAVFTMEPDLLGMLNSAVAGQFLSDVFGSDMVVSIPVSSHSLAASIAWGDRSCYSLVHLQAISWSSGMFVLVTSIAIGK